MKRFVTTIILLSMLIVPVIAASCSSGTSSWTYKLSSDYDQGQLFNVAYDDTSGGLVLSEVQTTYSLMWIANSGEDTISKWDTENNREMARYDTWFGNDTHDSRSGAAPSRTCVDSEGNCYVANSHFDAYPADVIKILADSFVDRNDNGLIDTCTDTDGDGVISATELAPYELVDSNSNGKIDDDEIKDERIAWVITVGKNNGLGRSLSIDTSGYIWFGLYNSRTYYKLSPDDGSIVAGPISVGVTPYVSLVDKHGILWGLNNDDNLLRLDTTDNSFSIIPLTIICHSIALGYDDDFTQVYLSTDTWYPYIQYDTNPATNPYDELDVPADLQFGSLAICTDSSGNIYCSNHDDGGGVTKFAPNGSEIWTADRQTDTRYDNRAAAVDSEGNVWVCLTDSNKLSKFDGSTGDPLGVFDCGQGPYTYSAAAGLGQSQPQGTWMVVVDSGDSDTEWSNISWKGDTPAGTEITVRVCSSNDNVNWSSWETVTSGEALSDTPDGQYLKVAVTLKNTSGSESPVLLELKVNK